MQASSVSVSTLPVPRSKYCAPCRSPVAVLSLNLLSTIASKSHVHPLEPEIELDDRSSGRLGGNCPANKGWPRFLCAPARRRPHLVGSAPKVSA